ncbi:centromere protein T [Gastrophryne carolinensis]
MEDTLQDNITTRSLLKGILATEVARPPVHRTRKSISGTPKPIIHQDEVPASPSCSLRSQMKERVRRSLRRSAVENSSVKKSVNAKTRRKSDKGAFRNVVEELDKITPRTLLKKIIQNENEVSMIVSQGSKAAVFEDNNKEESMRHTLLNSIGNLDLSMSDLQNTENHTEKTAFRNTRKKRKLDVSQFAREVDGKIQGISVCLDANFDGSSSENLNGISRSFPDYVNISTDPQSTHKEGLRRKPNKALLISLGDFEQGVEDKYHLLKGSQECFIESVVEDKSSASASKVAELNTELYVQPPSSAAYSFEKSVKNTSKVFALSNQKKNEERSRLLESDANATNMAVSLQPLGRSLESSETNRSIQIVQEKKDVEQSNLNQNMDNSTLREKSSKSFKADVNVHHSVLKNNSQIVQNQSNLEATKQHTQISMSKEDQASFAARNDMSFNTTPGPELLLKQGARPSKVSASISRLANEDSVQLDSTKNDASDPDHDKETSPTQSSVSEDNNEINSVGAMIKNSKLEEENENPYSDNELSSSQNDHLESSQDNLEDTGEDEIINRQEKANKRPMLSPLIDTPNCIKNLRFRAPPNKPYAGKKVQKVTTLKKKKEGAAFNGSFIKQIFSLHSKMRVSKEALTDVETCLEQYLDQLTGDLAAYTAHANRKTITGADLELLMKRQRLVTDTTSLNVLIERHLPLEYRKLLIPCATSGNKVFPSLTNK